MKIRPRTRTVRGTVYQDFVVDLGSVLQPDGGRKRQTRAFPTEAAAEEFMSEKMEILRDHGTAALGLRPETALRYAAVERRLAAAGTTIEQVADYWMQNHKPVKERITLAALLDRWILDMELRKVKANTIATFNCACRSFVEPRPDLAVTDVTRDLVKAWIYGNGWEPKTQRGYLGAMSTMLQWAVTEQYLVKHPLGRGSIKLPKLVKKEPPIFTLEQLRRLFDVALHGKALGVGPDGRRSMLPIFRRLIGFLALATFGGIRPFELVRLEVSALDLDAGHVPLDAKVTKTSDRRVVKLSENCIAFLRIWREEFPDYKRIAPPSWDRLMKEIRKAAQLTPWPHDVLRHSFASYFHAKHGDKKLLQNQMGHSESEDTLDKNYRAVRGPDGKPVTEAQAEEFWRLGPPGWTPAPAKKGKKKAAAS